MSQCRPAEYSAFGDQVRRALVDGGVIESIEAPIEEVEAVLARQIFEYRLKTFRTRLLSITTAQIVTLIIARGREAAKEKAKCQTLSFDG